MRESDHPMAGKDAVRPGLGALHRATIAAAIALAGAAWLPGGALALSELKQEDVPVPEEAEGAGTIERHQLPPPGEATKPAEDAQQDKAPEAEGEDEEQAPATQDAAPRVTVPFPDPIVSPRDPDGKAAEEGEDAATEDEPVPDVLYDVALLPEPAQRLRARLIEACLSGDIERLRPYLSTGENATQLSFGDRAGDPIAFLRELSGDEQGHEILAILYEVLTAGFVRVGEGTAQDMYVWPYFAAVPLDSLTPPQRVELFKIVTAGDYEDMKNYGTYIFYRAGISPEGKWLFFYAGD